MTAAPHPAASHHLPFFITAPGETDVLMVTMAVILAVCVVAFGVLFLRLHTLPERIAHRAHKLQFEIVAVLGLISLFTHMHIFWIAGLLLALIDLPDIGGWLGRIAGSVEKIAETTSSDRTVEPQKERVAEVGQTKGPTKTSHENVASIRRSDGAGSAKSEISPVSKELINA
jgi:hypothetical protein